MSKSKVIRCPKCGTRVGFYDGRTENNIYGNCSKCRKRITFHVDTKQITIGKIPQRTTSSGLTYRW